MRDLFLERGRKAGLPPGTPVHIGAQREGPVRITAFTYDGNGCREVALAGPEDCLALRDGPGVSWINVDGVHDVPVVQRLCELFGVENFVPADLQAFQKAIDLSSEKYCGVSVVYRKSMELTSEIRIQE